MCRDQEHPEIAQLKEILMNPAGIAANPVTDIRIVKLTKRCFCFECSKNRVVQSKCPNKHLIPLNLFYFCSKFSYFIIFIYFVHFFV